MTYRDHPLTKYMDEYVIQGKYAGLNTWDDLVAETDRKEAGDRYREYQENDHHADDLRMITRRVPNPDHGRFKVGQFVKIHPATDAFMRGITGGFVTKVGREYVTVAWHMNQQTTRKFTPGLLEPEEERK